MTRIALLGRGVTGDRISKRLDVLLPGCTVVACDPRGDLREAFECDAAILAHGGLQVRSASKLIEAGIAVVSTADNVDDIQAMAELHDVAAQQDVPLVVGAGMSPGLTGLLARYLANKLDTCDEIHIAVHGTAGPECARQHHRALAGHASGLHDGEQISKRAGTGRELCWFPEPVGAYDCYRAEMASPMLLSELFGEVDRISARMSANRRDRLTARLPMLSPPHREGGVGAVRVEVRGADASGERSTLIVGVAELVATCAAATAVAFTAAAVRGDLKPGVIVAGDATLDTIGLLHDIERLGVRLQEFTGIPHPAHPVPVTAASTPTTTTTTTTATTTTSNTNKDTP